MAIKKEIAHERLNIRTPLQTVALEVYMTGKVKRKIFSKYLPPTNLVMEEDMRCLLEQLPAPMILLGDFKAHNQLWGSEKISIRGRMLEKIFDRFNLFCLNKKKTTYYRALDCYKLTIHLTLANQTIAPEYK